MCFWAAHPHSNTLPISIQLQVWSLASRWRCICFPADKQLCWGGSRQHINPPKVSCNLRSLNKFKINKLHAESWCSGLLWTVTSISTSVHQAASQHGSSLSQDLEKAVTELWSQSQGEAIWKDVFSPSSFPSQSGDFRLCGAEKNEMHLHSSLLSASGAQGPWQITFVSLSPWEGKNMQYRNVFRSHSEQSLSLKAEVTSSRKSEKIGLNDPVRPPDLPNCQSVTPGQCSPFPTQEHLSIANTCSFSWQSLVFS